MIGFFRKYVTIEPSLFIFLIVYEWMKGLDTNLFLQKACRFNSTTEPDLNTRCDDEKQGILFVSEVGLKYHSVVLLISLLVSIVVSCWSDEAGRRRKPLILIPFTGQVLHTLSGCVHSYFWKWSPTTAVLWWAVLESISGGVFLLFAGCCVYTCDVSTQRNRTMRLGFVGAIRLICLILGKGGSGFILRNLGFFYSYSLCVALSAFGLIFSLVFIKDVSVSVERKIPIYQMLNLKNRIISSFKAVFSEHLGSRRIVVSLLITAKVAVDFTLFGELSVLYPYLRYKFGWDEQQYSNYMFYRFSGSALGILFCSVVLSSYLKIHDGLIGILAAIFDTIAVTGLLFTNQIWQLYLIPLVDLFHGTAMTICLSFMSKFYSPDEVGRLSAVTSVFSLIIPLSLPAYNAVFQNTLDSFPSAFCLLSIMLDIAVVLCYGGSYVLSKKIDKKKPIEVQEETRSMITSS